MLLKAWIVGGMLQGTARTLAADAANIDPARVAIVDGLDVRMTGFADQASADVAVAEVEALDSSWDVEAIVDETAAPAVEEADEPAPTTTAAPAPAALDPAAVNVAAVAGGAVVLTGTVANDDVRAAIVEQAETTFGADNVTDELQIDPDAVSPDTGAMTITGVASSDAEREEWIAGATVIADQAGLELTDDVTVETVQDQLNALFALEPIEFDTSRATIRDSSVATLDEAAAVINANPDAGQLNVVGHTDSDGAAAANLDLSERRAQAVVEYLVTTGEVDPGRLEAEGRGETELLVDPEVTAEDKQRNRRIEWELLS